MKQFHEVLSDLLARSRKASTENDHELAQFLSDTANNMRVIVRELKTQNFELKSNSIVPNDKWICPKCGTATSLEFYQCCHCKWEVA